MATKTFGTVAGNWNDDSKWVGGVKPTAADDVVFTGASANLTLDADGSCRSIDFTNFAGGFSGGIYTLNIGDASGGSFKAVVSMTWGYSSPHKLNFVSTSNNGGAGWAVTTSGKLMPHTTFNGVGGKWVLQDSWASFGTTQTVTLQSGTLDTNNQACSWGFLWLPAAGGGTRTLTLGSSALAMTGAGNTLLWEGATTHTANTAVATFSASSSGVNNGSWNGLSVVFAATVGTAYLLNGPTLKNVTFVNPTSYAANLFLSGPTQATGTLTITGSGGTNRVLVQNNTLGGAATYTAAAVALTNVDFQDITGAGLAANAPWTGTSLGDCYGNSNITTTTPVTRYWVGGSGNWSDTAHWSTVSNGAGGATVPLPQDTARMDANSFTAGSSTPTVNMPRPCKNWDWTGATNSPTMYLGMGVSIYGSITGVAGWQRTSTGANILTLVGRGTHTITCAGMNWPGFYINAPGGSYTLQDAFSSTNGTALYRGTFDANGYNFTAVGFGASLLNSTRTVNMGTGTWTLGYHGTVWDTSNPTGLTLNPSTATIVCTEAPVSPQTAIIVTGGLTMPALTVNGGPNLTVQIYDSYITTGMVTLTQGTLDTNSKTCSWGAFSSNNSNPRALMLGSSSVTLTANGSLGWSINPSTGMTLTAGTSTLTLSGGGAQFNFASGSSLTYNNVVFSGSGIMQMNLGGSTVFANLTRTGTASVADGFYTNANFTVTGTLTLTGNSAANRMLVATNMVGSSRTITAAAVALTNVDFMDIVGGGAATWAGTSIGDCLGNASPNLLTLNQASFETDVTTGLTVENGSVARSTAQFLHGTASCLITTANTGGGIGFQGSATIVPATAGTTYTAVASFRIGNIARTCSAKMRFFDAAKAQIGGSNFGSPVVSSTSWSQSYVTATAPTNTAYVGALGAFNDAAAVNGDTVYVDCLGLFASTNTAWSSPAGITFDSPSTQTWEGGAFLSGGYLQLPGVTGNYASVPDSAALSVTGDIDVRVKCALTDWTPATINMLASKYLTTANQRAWSFQVSTDGKLVFQTTPDGISATVVAGTSTVTNGIADGAVKWVRATRSASTGTVRFYLSDDGTTWTQLGTDCATGASSIFDNTTELEIGAYQNGGGNLASGNFYRAQVLNGINGTVVFDADFTAPAHGALSFTESSSNTATVTVHQANSGGGNWSDVSKWTTRVPLPQDNVVIGSTVAAGATITADMPRMGKDINCTGFTRTLNLGTTLHVYGSITLASGMTLTGWVTIRFLGRSTHTITSAGIVWPVGVFQVGMSGASATGGGTYSLSDALVLNHPTTGTFLLEQACTFTTNNFALTVGTFGYANGTYATLNLGSSNVTCYTPVGGYVWVVSGIWTINAGTSTINLARTSGTVNQQFAGSGKTYYNLAISSTLPVNDITIVHANTFNNISVAAGTQLTMPASTTNTINGKLIANGVPNVGYVSLPGVAGNEIATTTNNLSSLASLEFRIRVRVPSFRPATIQYLCGWDSTHAGISFNTAGALSVLVLNTPAYVTIGGAVSSSAVPANLANTWVWLRGKVTVSSAACDFYYSSDNTNDNTAVSWTSLGTGIVGSNAGTTPALTQSFAVVMGTKSSGLAGMVGDIRSFAEYVDGTARCYTNGISKTFGANNFTGTDGQNYVIYGALAQAGDGRVALVSSTPATPATLASPLRQSCDYLTVQDSTATGVGGWYAGAHSVSVSGNSGWLFKASPSGNFFAFF